MRGGGDERGHAPARLARYQAAAGGNVTNACHIPVELDEIARQLVILLDGTRTAESIARDLKAFPGAPPLKEIRRHLPASLAWLARMALLEEPSIQRPAISGQPNRVR